MKYRKPTDDSPVHCPVCGREIVEGWGVEGGWECICGEFIPKGLAVDSFLGSTSRIMPHFEKKKQ